MGGAADRHGEAFHRASEASQVEAQFGEVPSLAHSLGCHCRLQRREEGSAGAHRSDNFDEFAILLMGHLKYD